MKTKLVVGFFILFLVALVPSASALEDSIASPTAKPTIKRLQNVKENAKSRASAAAEKKAERLSESRLKVCRGRTISLHNRAKGILGRGSRMHKRLEALTMTVDKFYQNRLVPQGLILENYDELLADIDAKKANVSLLLDAAKVTGEDFDCGSDDPKGQLEAFNEDMKEVLEAFKQYKQSVRTFVKAVKDLAVQNRDSLEEEVVQ
ncbi:MAG: hypothetical protein ACD_37C00646G0002 [uncultured bacterium]|nr:MAG: hypothetical protein ACD_37C00646G0002 [uncultured bacterium]KKR16618.1 MAG: hypothetical protein UT46_C0004G0019 [Candidatus Levybacteria bacterium GW2011_GWA1_39_34]KKR51274.1 MAG: hypothetical protein UT87_C0007G0034 [Candidatus Levybacteria bacterium GW2011_GWC1_40_19]KKR73843.1 MAG: hypothetical protein UU15_C0001G0018 [Candidatus Levybacteria bacterium GW2011_GWC2_40_7]KKR94639.1 MAG: hypothetical protein UU45_C0008G0039 [Candidatus Levybacteria bacterium GW2011_GWA2_41_15]KKS020